MIIFFRTELVHGCNCRLKQPGPNIMQSCFLPNFLTIFTVVILMAFHLFIPGVQGICAAKDKIPIYFYSSETNINNYKSLKMEFDAYLIKQGAFQFQPFNDRDAFENHVKKEKRCLFITSSWHLRNIRKNYRVAPLLAGTRNGRGAQKRIVVTAKGEKKLKAPVASSSSIPHTRSLLKQIFPANTEIDSIRILTVPKDVDALMSVGFQMAKTALTTENALENIKSLDSALHKRLSVIGESLPSMLLVVSAPEAFVSGGTKAVNAIRRMPDDLSGSNVLKMLDLDGWKPVKSTDLK